MGHLLERDDALALLTSEMRRTADGHGRLVVLRGASGTGRSALLEAAIEHAKASGFHVLSVRCPPEETPPPLSTVSHLMGSVAMSHRAEPDPTEQPDGAEFCQALHAITDESPVLLAVDDAQFADPASRDWLTEAIRRIDSSRILLVVTERGQYDIPLPPPSLNRALPASVAIAHTLSPLTASAASALVRAAAPTAASTWVADCVHASAGNPLLLQALLEDVGAESSSPLPEMSAALYPGSYPAAVGWWLNSAGAATRQVARALAVAEHDGLREPAGELARFLAAACETDPARTLGWLTAMRRLRVLREGEDGSVRYAHPLLRDAVLADWPTERREAVSGSFADTMLRRGDHVEAVARQLLRSGPVRQGWALRTLEDAASTATSGERPEDAIRYLRRALTETETDSDTARHRLLKELGILEYRHGNASAGLQRLHEALLVAAAPQDRARTAIALGTALTERGETRDAVGLLRETKRELGTHPAAAWSVQAATLLLSERDQSPREAGHRKMLKGPMRDRVAPSAGRALLVRQAALAGEITAQKAMTQVRALLGEPTDDLSEPFLLSAAATVALWADELDEAEGLAERGLAKSSWMRLHPAGQALHAVRAEIALIRGDYKGLLGDHAPARRPGSSALDSFTLHALTELGCFEEARRPGPVRDGDLHPGSDVWELSRFRYASGVLPAAQGDVSGALHDFLDCGRRLSAPAGMSPFLLPWRTGAAMCRLAKGDRSGALVLAREELRLAQAWNTPRSVGRALHGVAVATAGRDGLELGAEAVRILRQSPDARDLISALLSHGRQLAASGRRTRAREHYQEAARHAERLGSVRLRIDAERDLRTVGVRRPSASFTGSESLTGSELRVAELAARGHTNTEISHLLQVTRRTVESHLTRSYSKLGINGRDELRTALRGVEENS
ncbi:AAA family ATPase [Streptomyces scopuliridis]|uniref:AAA family ATPase n=1 Tax=Streptomyces scopuliridis TaxID=452529 RepID=UPI0036B6BD80